MTLPLSASPVPSLSLSSSLSMWEVLLSRVFLTVPHYMDKAAEIGAWEPAQTSIEMAPARLGPTPIITIVMVIGMIRGL